MGKLQKNQDGFGAVEAVLVLVIVILIGVVGWMVYKNHHKTAMTAANNVTKTATSPTTPATTKSTTPDPYAGWNTYTLKQEKLTFRYPSNWTLKDMSDSNNDFETLSGTNNFQMTVGAGAGVASVTLPFGGATVVQADPITFAGQSGFIDLWTDEGSGSNSVYSMWLSQSSSQVSSFFPSKHITQNASNSSVVALMDYKAPNDTNFTNEPLSYVVNDTNFKDAKLLIQSMHY